MTFNELCSEIAKREGKKSQVKIGDVREIVKIIRELLKEDVHTMKSVLQVLLK